MPYTPGELKAVGYTGGVCDGEFTLRTAQDAQMTLTADRKTCLLYTSCYHDIPEKLDPFDQKTFQQNPMDFFVVCTDLRTGDPIYHKCRTGDAEDVRWMEAVSYTHLDVYKRQS